MFEVQPLEGSMTGVQVIGLKPPDIEDPTVRQALYNLWIDKGLVVFRGLNGPEVHIALSEVFGPCISHPAKVKSQTTDERLISISYDQRDGDICEVDGVPCGAWVPWHTDLIYVDRINHGGILRPIHLAPKGGETAFLDKIAVYETLPDELKKKTEGLHVVYKWDVDLSHQKFGRNTSVSVLQWSKQRAELQSRIDDYPLVMHPIVFEQPETGRKVLNVSPLFSIGIAEMDDEAGDALLSAVVDHIVSDDGAYFHKYRLDDMVLWDNWRMWHSVTGIDVAATRSMERTTIAGDYALGRVKDSGAVIDDRTRISV